MLVKNPPLVVSDKSLLSAVSLSSFNSEVKNCEDWILFYWWYWMISKSEVFITSLKIGNRIAIKCHHFHSRTLWIFMEVVKYLLNHFSLLNGEFQRERSLCLFQIEEGNMRTKVFSCLKLSWIKISIFLLISCHLMKNNSNKNSGNFFSKKMNN